MSERKNDVSQFGHCCLKSRHFIFPKATPTKIGIFLFIGFFNALQSFVLQFIKLHPVHTSQSGELQQTKFSHEDLPVDLLKCGEPQ